MKQCTYCGGTIAHSDGCRAVSLNDNYLRKPMPTPTEPALLPCPFCQVTLTLISTLHEQPFIGTCKNRECGNWGNIVNLQQWKKTRIPSQPPSLDWMKDAAQALYLRNCSMFKNTPTLKEIEQILTKHFNPETK